MRCIQVLCFSLGTLFLNNTIKAGSLSFSASTYTALENAANLTVTVNRTGSTAAAAGVTVVSVNGTASASDFTAVSQALSWGIGDSAPL